MRRFLLLVTLLIASMFLPRALGPAVNETLLYAQGQTQVQMAQQFPGADAAAKIKACIAALPAKGGVCDARGLTGDQTLGSDMFAGVRKSGVLRLGHATYTINATQNPPASWQISGAIGGAAPGGLSTAVWGTRFVLGAAPVAFKFNDFYTGKLENAQIDCGSQPGSVGIWYTADNLNGLSSSQDEFTNFGVYNCQVGIQIGPPVTDKHVPSQMDQLTVRRFQIISTLPGAQAVTFNASNAAQGAVFEDGMIQKVNMGFNYKWYGGGSEIKRVYFGAISNGPAFRITNATNTSPIVVTTSSPHGYTYSDGVFPGGDRVRIAGVSGNTAANGQWYVTVIDSTHFSLNGSRGNGGYGEGGTAVRLATCFNLTFPSDYWIEESQSESGAREEFQSIARVTNSTPIVVTVPNHGFQTGDVVGVAGVSGNTAANSKWQITRIDANNFSLNGSAGNGNATITDCVNDGPYNYRGGSCVQRFDVNFININGSPFNGRSITLLGDTFDEPVVVNRTARITSISNYGPAPGIVTAAGAGSRIVSINDRFTDPGTFAGWDTSAGGQVLRLGGGDRGADSMTISLPGVRFSGLGTPPNGTIVYCTDCNSSCTSAGGTGQMCFRVNGAWTH